MAYILHIDTSGDTGLTAIAKDGIVLAQRTNTDARNHASAINIHIDDLLHETAINMKDIAAIAVCGGPGSYTGLRIGLSSAKGLCYALDIPLLLHNKLLQLTVDQHYIHLSQYEFYGCVLTARDKEYFISIYNKNLEVIFPPQHIHEAELYAVFEKYETNLLLTGNITEEMKRILYGKNIKLVDNQAVDIHTWATYSFERYNCNDYVSLATVTPFYLKGVYTHKSKIST